MKRMTVGQVADFLKGIRQGATFIGFTSESEPKMRKTNNPYFGKVVKVNTHNAKVNCDYEAGVNRRLDKEGKEPDFVAKGNWHAPLMIDDKYTPLAYKVSDPDELYLRYFPEKSGTPVFVDKETGELVDKAKLAPFMPAPSTYENQGLDSPNEIKVMKLSNIRRISIAGEDIEVIG